MNGIIIQKAGIKEWEIIQSLGRKTFIETFAESNTEANMNVYLTESFTEEKLKSELTNPDSLFFIAWDDESPVGYLKLNIGKAQTEPQDESFLEIERIYVLAAYHGKKVGQLLYEKALESARLLHKSTIWLGVWEHNLRALRFYEKNGFAPFGKHLFVMGDDQQTDIMMQKKLDV
ncbi:GNAT family N-acetyltransferase [Taibaiella soli]|uniref:GNAT family N-acetyltransferase n=1 Tax=Taibaiella soli TaxID=1649169 RepID=A0A2W2AFK3_9BACT|nr:GNAT family N-acetyltransferase [Taibaiella soli]PZF70980.1 GNAT family N-acetyltransferase [Taibaiella soli]